MQKNIVLKDKCILVIQNIMVAMATQYATLKNEGVPTKNLILLYLTWYQINSWIKQFISWFDMQII